MKLLFFAGLLIMPFLAISQSGPNFKKGTTKTVISLGDTTNILNRLYMRIISPAGGRMQVAKTDEVERSLTTTEKKTKNGIIKYKLQVQGYQLIITGYISPISENKDEKNFTILSYMNEDKANRREWAEMQYFARTFGEITSYE